MEAFGWSELATAMQERAIGTMLRTTDAIDNTMFHGLDKLDVAYSPQWQSLSDCRSIYRSLTHAQIVAS